MILHDLTSTLPFDLPGLAFRHARINLSDPPQPTSLRVIASDAPDYTPCLPVALQAAVPRRQTEFLAGRACAALALHALASPILSVDFNPDRSPNWPQGFVGSITHSATHVCAIAARANRYAMLGLDLEHLMPDAQALEIADLILTPAEAMLRPAALSPADFTTLVFSAKEALYKAIYPKLQRIIEFHDVTLTALSPGGALMRLGVHHPDLPTYFRASTLITAETCLTLVTA